MWCADGTFSINERSYLDLVLPEYRPSDLMIASNRVPNIGNQNMKVCEKFPQKA